MHLILDAHEDISSNILGYQRDYRRSAAETQAIESAKGLEKTWPPSLLGWEDWNKGRVGIVFSTLYEAPHRPDSRKGKEDRGYKSIEEANQRYWKHPALYHRLADENPSFFRMIESKADLSSHLTDWESQDPAKPETYKPIGFVQLMEGAEGILGPDELPKWWEAGIRIVGLAWMGNQYCGGTNSPGPLTKAGKELVKAMEELGFCIDIAHLDEESVWDLFDIYHGPIIASHDNASSLVKNYQNNRLISDEIIRTLIERDGVVGIVPANRFLDMSKPRESGKAEYPLSLAVDQFDHICQLAGNARHVGFGTDFDGGFGVPDVVDELNSIADLPKILKSLAERGYSEPELGQIASGNFLRVIESVLPE